MAMCKGEGCMLGFLTILSFLIGWLVAHLQKGIKFEIVKKGLEESEVEENTSYGDPRYVDWANQNFPGGDI